MKYTVTQEKEKTWLNVYNKENISNLEEGWRTNFCCRSRYCIVGKTVCYVQGVMGKGWKKAVTWTEEQICISASMHLYMNFILF